MSSRRTSSVHRAVHARCPVRPDPRHEIELAQHIRSTLGIEGVVELYSRFAHGAASFDAMMRRVLWRAAARRFGNGARIGVGVGFKHLETFEIGDGVFIGDHAYLQGRHEGRLTIGDHTWIGPQAYLDARALRIGRYVGWGPGAKVLGSEHTAIPVDAPIIQTDLVIKPVVVEDEADIGVNACLLPGVRIGKGSIVGAGAVVTRNVPRYAVVAGVPAVVLRNRRSDDRCKGGAGGA